MPQSLGQHSASEYATADWAEIGGSKYHWCQLRYDEKQKEEKRKQLPEN